MRAVLLASLLGSLGAFVIASPLAQDTKSADNPISTLKRRRTHNCNQEDNLKKIEAQAWADSGALADVANEYDYGNKWQPAMDLWMGGDSTESKNFWKIQSKVSRMWVLLC